MTSEALLSQLLAEVRSLRSAMEEAGLLLPAAPDAALVAAIGDAVGGRVFTASELVGHVETVGDPLARLMSAGLGGKLTSRGVGKLLARLDGKPCDGLEVRRLGDDRNGAIWAVRPAG